MPLCGVNTFILSDNLGLCNSVRVEIDFMNRKLRFEKRSGIASKSMVTQKNQDVTEIGEKCNRFGIEVTFCRPSHEILTSMGRAMPHKMECTLAQLLRISSRSSLRRRLYCLYFS